MYEYLSGVIKEREHPTFSIARVNSGLQDDLKTGAVGEKWAANLHQAISARKRAFKQDMLEPQSQANAFPSA